MNKIKSIWLSRFALIAAMALTATACQQDDIIERVDPTHQGELISFHIQRGWDYDQISRSADSEYGNHLSNHILASEDQSESIEMSAYQQPINTWFDGAESRGTMITQANDNFNAFRVYAYQDGTTDPMFTTDHQKDGGMWEKPVGAADSENADGYYWPGADYTCSFYGIAMSDGKTDYSFFETETEITKDATTGQVTSFNYTVPDNAVDQPDIMIAATKGVAGNGSEGASLKFKHILSAINIKVGTADVADDITGVIINSITFNNIYAKGTYTIATNAWSNTAYHNIQKSFSIDFNGSTTGNGTYADFEDNSGNVMNATAATLMLIPQTLRNDATVTVSYTLSYSGGSRDGSATANIGGQVWEAGKAINYVLNIDNSDGISFLTQDSYVDAHYIILPLNIKCQNPGGTVTLRAIDVATDETADWVKFRENLVVVENDGWWADPDNVYNINSDGEETGQNTSYSRSNTLTVSDTGQCFAFLTENIGTTNRQVRFELVVNNVSQDEITISQLCPTWNGTKGCERIEEGESLPWGYSWVLNEGQTDYKVTVKTSGILSTIWMNIVNWLYGGAASSEVKAESWNLVTYFTFNYTDFINEMSDETTGAGSTTNGLQNTTYMFNYTSAGNMLGFYTYLINNGGTVNSETFTGISYTEYATKEALKKNKIKVYVGTNAGNEEHNPIINASRTDLWYLPATGEVSILQNNTNMVPVETMMNSGDIFWTSTAAETPNAYSYTFGGSTQTENRDNAHRVRAIRNITTTTTTTAE